MTSDLPPAEWIDAGDSHSLLVTDDGGKLPTRSCLRGKAWGQSAQIIECTPAALFTWGFGTMGALCNGEWDDVDNPSEVTSIFNCNYVHCNYLLLFTW